MSENCRRFESEALLLLEEGRPLPEHFATCADCLRAQAAYQQLRAALEKPLASAPRDGWEARVMQAVDAAPPARTRWQESRWLAAGSALAAAAVVVIALRVREPDEPLGISAQVTAGPAGLRGASAHPGDRLQLEAKIGRARHAELRVWRDGRELVMRCSGTTIGTGFSCLHKPRALAGELRLPSVGTFQATVAIGDDAPLPPPAATLAEDSARLLAAGARLLLAEPARVY